MKTLFKLFFLRTTVLSYLITLFSVILLSAPIFAQVPDTLWTHIYGGNRDEECYTAEQTFDEGFIMIIRTASYDTAGAYNLWLVKTDKKGDTLWTRNYGWQFYDLGYDVKQTKDSGYILTGHTDFTGMGGRWLIKTDKTGEIMWSKILGKDPNAYGTSVIEADDGGFVVTGTDWYAPSGYVRKHIILLKTNSSGDTLWTRYYGGTYGVSEGKSVKQTKDGGYIITGVTELSESTGLECWLLKTDSSGDTLWTKMFTGPRGDEGDDVIQTADDGYAIVGYTSSYSSGQGADLWLIKADKVGELMWTKVIGGIYHDIGSSIRAAKDSGYIMTGRTASFVEGPAKNIVTNLWIVRTDKLGNLLWQKSYGKYYYWEGGNTIRVTGDNGYIIGGVIQPTTYIQTDAWLLRMDSDPLISVEPREINTDFPDQYILYQNYPNPFNPGTVVSYQLPAAGKITIKIYDLLGREIETLIDEEKPAGKYEINWNASELPGGVYFYQIKAGSFVKARKMILIR